MSVRIANTKSPFGAINWIPVSPALKGPTWGSSLNLSPTTAAIVGLVSVKLTHFDTHMIFCGIQRKNMNAKMINHELRKRIHIIIHSHDTRRSQQRTNILLHPSRFHGSKSPLHFVHFVVVPKTSSHSTRFRITFLHASEIYSTIHIIFENREFRIRRLKCSRTKE